jgi:hypothetical protein
MYAKNLDLYLDHRNKKGPYHTDQATKPKHELITSHIAGKTFITLAPKLWNLSPAEIAAIVGKNVQTLLKHYFGDQGDEAREKMIRYDQMQLDTTC